MKFGRTRLDVFVRRRLQWSLRQTRKCMISGGITVDGRVAESMSQIIGQFSCVEVDGQTITNQKATYILLYKPKGVVSATKDSKHITVVDVLNFGHIKKWHFTPACCRSLLLRPLNYSLLQRLENSDLHIAGRLDFNSTGIVLLTNDGRWSRGLSLPGEKIPKRYQVTLESPLSEDYVDAFSQGFFFAYENLTTLPAKLKLINSHEAEVTLVEGRYHQIKRMFGFFDNKVLQLHRVAVGPIVLDDSLKVGDWRYLTTEEVEGFPGYEVIY